MREEIRKQKTTHSQGTESEKNRERNEDDSDTETTRQPVHLDNATDKQSHRHYYLHCYPLCSPPAPTDTDIKHLMTLCASAILPPIFIIAC